LRPSQLTKAEDDGDLTAELEKVPPGNSAFLQMFVEGLVPSPGVGIVEVHRALRKRFLVGWNRQPEEIRESGATEDEYWGKSMKRVVIPD
jgi:hypothetical protein